jgi:5S rRNA maturation endonuclease (ribonuclease M5)
MSEHTEHKVHVDIERPSKTYEYKDENRRVIQQVRRFDDPKTFRSMIWNDLLKKWEPGFPEVIYPYNLNGITAPIHEDEPIFICEGEKDADNVASLGYHINDSTSGLVATTFPSGSYNFQEHMLKYFKGREVYIIRDMDWDGLRLAKTIVDFLYGHVKKINIIDPPEWDGETEGYDISDWVEAKVGEYAKCINYAQKHYRETQEKARKMVRDDLVSHCRKQPPHNYVRLVGFNRRYSVVRLGGKTLVMYFQENDFGQLEPDFQTRRSFEDYHSSSAVAYDVNKDGTPKLKFKGKWWFEHKEAPRYDGVTLAPGDDRKVIDGRINLWRGWPIEPREGDWSLMRQHILEVLAGGNEEHAAYITKWAAWAVQHPAEVPEVVLVFRGGQGTGKGIFGRSMMHLFGQHGRQISDIEKLVGKFNARLLDAVLLFADEAYWPGHKSKEGAFKRLITEPTLEIEKKGVDTVEVRNNLHIIMASNEDWVVPADKDVIPAGG